MLNSKHKAKSITTRVQMIIQTLQANPKRQFTARESAQEFIIFYPADLEEKRKNPRYDTKEKLITQLAAEIGGERTEAAKKQCPNVPPVTSQGRGFIIG